jgi:prepilin-type N-terminal cleavage/methylation domain-containing protein
VSRWRDLFRRTTGDASGFALVEIIVALSVIGLAAAASTPLLITGIDASVTARMNTQAKNLAQQRIESMRDLQFHVDRQNGPFIDLLDIYYTDRSTTAVTRTRANEVEVGQWVSGGAAAPAPSGPFYKIQVAQVPGSALFSQTIYTQFLDYNGSPVAATAFANYNSQTEGLDSPPTNMVGVTVVTSWTRAGSSHSYASYTRIADSRGAGSSVTSQASGNFLRLSATGASANSLSVDLLDSMASGALSTGSLATADIRSLQATDAAADGYAGATAVATSPSGGGSQNSPVSAFSSTGDTANCGWVSAGITQVADVSAATTSGLPQVPSDLDVNVPPTHQSGAQLMGGGSDRCGSFGFSNQSTSYDSNLMLASNVPLVRLANDTSTTLVANSTSWVNASAAVGTSHSVTSGAGACSSKTLQLFPGASFVTDGYGVLDVRLTTGVIACSSTVVSGVNTSASTGSWSITIDYWRASDLLGHGTRTTLGTYTWNSATGSGSADPLASVNPASLIVYQNGLTVLHLSDYISSWSTARSIVENPGSGLHQLNGIVSITTQPVRSGDLLSAVGVLLGNLSCVADDSR